MGRSWNKGRPLYRFRSPVGYPSPAVAVRRHDIEAMLRRTDVSSARVSHTDEVVPMIVRMLEKRRRGR